MNGDERRRLKRAYQALFEEASAILLSHDPMGLGSDTPSDEYDPEARTILPRLTTSTSVEDVQRVVHEEFSRWFGPDLAGPADRYDATARELWDLWQRSEANRGDRGRS